MIIRNLWKGLPRRTTQFLGRGRSLKYGCTRSAFTLIEALVSITLLAVGVAAVIGALGSFSYSEAKALESELGQRLALRKLDELKATGEIQQAPLSGTFEEEGDREHEWKAELDPSGVENLNSVRVTVTKNGSSAILGTAEGLEFRPPVEGGDQ